jgi:hypothetical protein
LTRVKLQRLIHAGARALGLDEDGRHALQQAATGKASLTEMTVDELRAVLSRMSAAGFDPAARRRRPRAPRADLRLVHVLWRRLGEAGLLERAGREGLNAFVRARFGRAWGAEPADIDMVRDHAQIEAVIRALKEIGRRGGLDLERREP